MNPKTIKNLLENEFTQARVRVDGEGAHFDLVVISEIFAGKNTLQRQKLIYRLLGEYIAQGEIHALTMQTLTPQEYKEKHG